MDLNSLAEQIIEFWLGYKTNSIEKGFAWPNSIPPSRGSHHISLLNCCIRSLTLLSVSVT